MENKYKKSSFANISPQYSVSNLTHSYTDVGPMPPSRNAHRQTPPAPPYSHALYPEDHRDDYSNEPYQPHPQDDSYPLTTYPTHYDDDDRRPILDPHSQLNTPLTGPGGDRNTPSPSPSTAGLRRWKTVKKVELFNGNLVLDCPVPKKLLGMLPQKKEREFTHMRWVPSLTFPISVRVTNMIQILRGHL